jgi:hypothetical protein
VTVPARLRWLAAGLLLLLPALALRAVWSARAPAAPIRVQASAADSVGAARVLDGRAAGSDPLGFTPGADRGAAWVELVLRVPLPIRGVVARFVGPDAERAALSLDGRALAPALRTARAVLWLLEAPAAQRVRLDTSARVGRLEPITGAPALVVLEGDAGGADALLEILRGYGAPAIALPAAPAALRALTPETRVVLVPGAHPAALRELLLRHVREGGTLLEPGPGGDLCAPAGGVETQLRNTRVQGPLAREPIHIVAHLAPDTDVTLEALLATPEGMPFLTARKLGRGRCLRLQADLVEVVRRLRQGDPALADRDTNHNGETQPNDLFLGSMQLADFARPHADLFVEALLAALALPYRLHPIPPAARGVLVLTADQDYVPDLGVLAQADDAAAPLTFLLTDGELGGKPDVDFGAHSVALLQRESAEALRQRGHELGIHPNLLGLPRSAHGGALAAQIGRFRARYGHTPRVVRNHHLVWSGFTEMAEREARLGLAMNLDFVAQAFAGQGTLGFLTGSGIPLRFIREDATTVPIFQQGTQLDDHVLLPARFGYQAHDVTQLISASKHLLDRSVEDPPHAIVVNHHPAWWYDTHGAFQRALIEHARARGIAVFGAERWLQQVQSMRAVVLAAEAPGRLHVLTADAPQALLLRGRVQARLNGQAATASSLKLAGIEHTRLALSANTDYLIEWSP